MRLLARNNVPLPMPRFADRLQAGERLLWEGRPNYHWFIWPKVIAGSLLLLPFLPPLMYLESLRYGTPLIWLSFKTLFLSLLIYLGTIVYLYQQSKAQAQAAAYAFSNRRLFVRRLERLTSQDWRPCIDEIPLAGVRLHLRPLGGGFSTITLGASVLNYEKALRGIPDAGTVFAQLTEAKAAVSEFSPAGTAASSPYYTKSDSPAQPSAAWAVEDTLRQGETVLWEGAVDAKADLRAGWWAIPFLALVMAAIGGWILSWLGNWTWPLQIVIFTVSLVIVLVIARNDSLTVGGKPVYVLTNRRVLIVKRAGKTTRKIEERELPETRNMHLRRGRDGIGTIIFEKKTRVVGQTVETYEFSFQHIADAEVVFGLIQAAQFGYVSRAEVRG